MFTRVHPFNVNLSLDGNLTEWWEDEDFIATWNEPLKTLDTKVLPYLLDIDNSTQMHAVMSNSTSFIEDAVNIAKKYEFNGWFIDYEDEYPPDTSPSASDDLADFLGDLTNALHKEGMELTICVASWSELLSDYGAIAESGVDELQQMSTYAMSNPDEYEPFIKGYMSGVGNPDQAGVGIGVYYDGVEYEREWDYDSAVRFVRFFMENGGTRLDVFRLLKDGFNDWPKEDWWWEVFEEFMEGNKTAGE